MVSQIPIYETKPGINGPKLAKNRAMSRDNEPMSRENTPKSRDNEPMSQETMSMSRDNGAVFSVFGSEFCVVEASMLPWLDV